VLSKQAGDDAEDWLLVVYVKQYRDVRYHLTASVSDSLRHKVFCLVDFSASPAAAAAAAAGPSPAVRHPSSPFSLISSHSQHVTPYQGGSRTAWVLGQLWGGAPTAPVGGE